MQAERAVHIPFIKITILTKENRTLDLNVKKTETRFVICTIRVYCLLIQHNTWGGQTARQARQAGTGVGIGPDLLTVNMNGDPPPNLIPQREQYKTVHSCVCLQQKTQNG